MGLHDALARLSRRIHFSRVVMAEDKVLKKRYPGTDAVVHLANATLRLARVPVRFLGEREWHRREVSVAALTGSPLATCVDGRGWVAMRRAKGEVLARILPREGERERAVVLAILGLGLLHEAGVTHGDATASNVAVDLRGESAIFFDFEQRHTGISFEAARADDLRALLFTCLLACADDRRRALAAAALQIVRPELRAALHASVAAKELATNPLHLAQIDGDRQAHRHIASILARSPAELG